MWRGVNRLILQQALTDNKIQGRIWAKDIKKLILYVENVEKKEKNDFIYNSP